MLDKIRKILKVVWRAARDIMHVGSFLAACMALGLFIQGSLLAGTYFAMLAFVLGQIPETWFHTVRVLNRYKGNGQRKEKDLE